MKQVGTAIVGGGFIGRIHAKAVLANGGKLVTIVDATPESSQALQKEFGISTAIQSFEAVLTDPDIQLVHICTPNHLHAEMALAVIKAGKHVVCEKPLATDAATAQELVDAAKAANLKTGVPFVYRFYAMVREAKSRVAQGELGKLNLLHGSYLQDWLLENTDNNWRVDPKLGGASRAFGDIGVHWCDLIEFVTGEKISEVIANIATVQDRVNGNGKLEKVTSEDVVTFMFKTASGVNGNAVISQVSAGRPNEIILNIDGSKSAYSFNQLLPETLWVGKRGETTRIYRGATQTSPESLNYSFVPSGHPQGYQDCFNGFYRDMIKTIDGESIPTLPTFEDGARAARITEAVLESVSTKSWTGVK